MVSFRFSSALLVFAISACVSHVQAVPVPPQKRVIEDVTAVTYQWEKACADAGGALHCSPITVAATSAFLATANACEQQDIADAMIDLAKQLNDNANMIFFAQIFARQPPASQMICEKAPKNNELNGGLNDHDSWGGDSSNSDGHDSGNGGTILDRDCACDSGGGGGGDSGWNGDNGNGGWGGDSGSGGGYDNGR